MNSGKIIQHAPLRAEYKVVHNKEIWIYVFCGICRSEEPLKARAYVSNKSNIEVRVHVLEKCKCEVDGQ